MPPWARREDDQGFMMYKIKHVGKRPFYFIDGEWITRGNVPEVRERKKKWRENPINHAKETKRMKDLYWNNPEQAKLRSNTWKRSNKEKVKKISVTYLNKERGYFMDMWNGIKKSRHGHNFKDYDDFYQCWLDQKAVHGILCPATGVEMTMIRGKSNHPGAKKTMTNISRDRILCTRGYSRQNLIFTTWRYNCSKGNMSPKGAKAFLKIVRERYGTDEVE